MTTAALASETLADAAGRRPDAAVANAPNTGDDALPLGTRLHEFELQRVLGIGGFGIVYLALDHALLRQVAIKEYMPVELARRGGGSQVSMRSAAHAETFTSGLHSFLKEAQLLARFDHPSLVKVHRYWEANGTAYMAMQYYAGRTLKEVREADASSPDEAALRRLVEPLLGALEVLHEQGVYHRDISPDNILLLPDGCPVLLDFGAARRVIGDRTQALTAVLKPNFAPIEQYGDVPGMQQGPWTDLYALGAVVHHMLTGRHPVPAVVRAMHDHMPALSALGSSALGISAPFLAAIDWTLGVRPQERPPNVQTLREALAGTRLPPPPTPRLPEEVADEGGATAVTTGWNPTVRHEPERTQPTSMQATAQEALPATQPQATVAPAAITTTAPTRAQAAAAPTARGQAEPAPRHAVLRRGIVALAAVLVGAGLGIWTLGTGAHSDTAQHPGDPMTMPAERAGARVSPPMPPSPAAIPATPHAAASLTDPAAGHATTIGAAPAAPAETQPAHHTEKATASTTMPSQSATRRHASDSGTAAKPAVVPDSATAMPATTTAGTSAADNVSPSAARRTANIAARPTPAPASPREACGDRNFLAMSICVSRRCLEPAFQQHPQCLELNAYEERRRQAQMRQ